ncbi:MAG: T9SS type A sorting domain-containing protein [Flavobacteriales bacterium]|jgi:hypothetical protein|nr:T9SS type A sorting domain-containing protein [Flavobacteriales bacterium]
MCKKVLLVGMLSVLWIGVRAQGYTPLLDNYNEWRLTSCYFGCVDDKYYTDGDTIVDGNSYKILDGYHYISRTFLLREDIHERKVYLKLANYNSRPDEFLLYDFSLSVGDSMNVYNPIAPFVFDAGMFQLDSIALHPLVDGNSYKHFYLHALDTVQAGRQNAVWIEGAGSLSLINAPGATPNVNGAGKISCFFKNDQLFYSQLDSTNECSTDYTVGVRGQELFDIDLITNHIDKNVLVKYNGIKPVELAIYTINGQLLTKQKIFSEEVVDISSFNKGILLFEFTIGEKKIFKKVLSW